MNRLAFLIAAPLLCAAPFAHAQEAPASTVITTATPAAAPASVIFSQGILFPYSILDRALTGRVDEFGNVDYVALKDNVDLKRFLLAVSTADTTKFPVFQVAPTEDELKINRAAKSRADRSAELVFWINAYNALVLQTVTDAYPIDAVSEIKDFDTAKHRVASEDLTFAQMRERIAAFDRRALFTLTDGSQGGPLLNPKAYRWADLGVLLQHAVETYINNDQNVTVTRIDNRVEVAPFLTSVSSYFSDSQIAGGAERKNLNGVRALLGQYTDKRANKSYLVTNDYRIIEKLPNRRLNVKGIEVRKLE